MTDPRGVAGADVKILVWTSIATFIAVVGGAGTAVWYKRQPETTSAMRGRELADSLGCFACHGPEGLGGVADPTSPGGEVPDWSYATAKLFVTSEQDVRDWILYGVPQNQAERTAFDDHEVLVPMPGYAEYLSAEQLDDLVAYFLAVSGWAPEIPKDAFEGRKTAMRLGCFGCHGPSGMGGVPNPGSFKGHIPPWDGEEFAELVRNQDELREWILEGTIERLAGNPAARFFLERQKTPMPAYHDHISDQELDELVAYINWLRSDRRTTEQQESGAESVIAVIVGG
jgi:mono/diheme cytochrome c family protein